MKVGKVMKGVILEKEMRIKTECRIFWLLWGLEEKEEPAKDTEKEHAMRWGENQ